MTITVGTVLPAWRACPSTVQLFRFSAVTWNAHRIHYDQTYARAEGYPDVLVQSHLHGCFLLQATLSWAGNDAAVRAFRWENRRPAIPGDELTVTGVVTAVETDETAGHRRITVDLEERNAEGTLCAPGRAVVAIPDRAA